MGTWEETGTEHPPFCSQTLLGVPHSPPWELAVLVSPGISLDDRDGA